MFNISLFKLLCISFIFIFLYYKYIKTVVRYIILKSYKVKDVLIKLKIDYLILSIYYFTCFLSLMIFKSQLFLINLLKKYLNYKSITITNNNNTNVTNLDLFYKIDYIDSNSSLGNRLNKLSILSWNILCQSILQTKYSYYKKNNLDINSLSFKIRLKYIIDKLVIFNNDILCLQEVTDNSLSLIFSNLVIKRNYNYVKGNNYNSKFFNVTIYNKNRFRITNYKIFSFEDIFKKYSIQGNKGILKVSLLEKKTSIIFHAYNVHMPWRPEHDIYKVFIFNEIVIDVFDIYNIGNIDKLFSKKFDFSCIKNTKDVILILGDFNSLPNSVLINMLDFFKSKFINLDNKEFKIDNQSKIACNINNNSIPSIIQYMYYILNNFMIHDNNILLSDKIVNEKDLNEEGKSILLNTIYTNLNSLIITKNNSLNRFKNDFTNKKHYLKDFCLCIINFYWFNNLFIVNSSYSKYKKYLSFQSNTKVEIEFSNNGLYPDFTNYTNNFKNTIDYILIVKLKYNDNTDLYLESILKLPDKEILDKLNIKTLPNNAFPSDHFPLVSNYKY